MAGVRLAPRAADKMLALALGFGPLAHFRRELGVRVHPSNTMGL